MKNNNILSGSDQTLTMFHNVTELQYLKLHH